MLTRAYICTRLCRRDPRNVEAYGMFGPPDADDLQHPCSCDNCFYERHVLADYILSLLEVQ